MSMEVREPLTVYDLSTTPEKLSSALQDALESLHRTLYRADPPADLSRPEVETLQRGGFELEPEELGAEDPLARTAAFYAAILETSLTAPEAAKMLGVDPSRIRQRLTSRPPSLLGIHLDRGWRLPRVQFEGGKTLPGLERLAAALDPQLHPVAVHRWLTKPNPDLEAPDAGGTGFEGEPLSPREWLLAGFPPDRVAALATVL